MKRSGRALSNAPQARRSCSMRCWNMTGGSVDERRVAQSAPLDLIEEPKQQRPEGGFARRTSRSHRNCHRALNLVHVEIAGGVAVSDPGLLHRAQFCRLLSGFVFI